MDRAHQSQILTRFRVTNEKRREAKEETYDKSEETGLLFIGASIIGYHKRGGMLSRLFAHLSLPFFGGKS